MLTKPDNGTFILTMKRNAREGTAALPYTEFVSSGANP